MRVVTENFLGAPDPNRSWAPDPKVSRDPAEYCRKIAAGSLLPKMRGPRITDPPQSGLL